MFFDCLFSRDPSIWLQLVFKFRGNFGYDFSSFFNLMKLVNGVDTILKVIFL